MPVTKLGIGSYTFPLAIQTKNIAYSMSLHQLLETAHAYELQTVQIADNHPLHLLTKEELISLGQRAADLGIDLEVGTRRLEEDHMLRYIEIAELLNSKFLRVVIDDVNFEPKKEVIIHTLQKLLPHLEKAGISLAIENHDRFQASDYADIIESTNSEWIGICLDTANSLGAGEGINEVLDRLWTYCLNLHIKDITITRVPTNMGFNVRGCPAGEGIINIPELIGKVQNNGKLISITLEQWTEDKGGEELQMREERKWVDKSIKYLKKLIDTYNYE